MKFKIILFLSILYVNCTTKDKSVDVSSINSIDSTKVWIQTAKVNNKLSKPERLQLLKKAENALTTYADNATKTVFLSELSLVYRRLDDTLSFRKKNAELISLSKKVNDYKSHAEAHWDLGVFYNHTQPDSAIYHYKEAYTLFLKVSLDGASISYPGRMLYSIATIKDNNKDHVGAEKDIVKAIKYYTENNINDKLFSAYNVLAVSQNGMGKYNKALEYHKKAKEFIPYSKENKKLLQQIDNINNMASTNLRKGDYPKAITFYKTLLDIENLFIKNPEPYAKAISGLAYAEFKNGSNDYEKLTNQFLKSNKILDSLNNKLHMARNHEYYAELLYNQNKIDLAIKNALLAKTIAEETSNNDRLLSTLRLLTTIDKKNSATYAKTYFSLSEKIQQKERIIQDKFARIELETDEAIEKNEALAKEKETLIWLSAGLLLLGIITFIIINQRTNNQRLKFKQSQQESNQEIYKLMLSQQGKLQEGKQLEQKRISEEIHDGILGQMLGIRLILSGLNERSDQTAITQRTELIDKLREVEEEMRTISHELNSAAYKKINNFIIAIQDLIHTSSLSSKIKILFEYTDTFDWDTLNGDIKINTYRIIQECIQNCIKHAKCKNISVNLVFKGNTIHLEIIDDGVGFNIKKGKKGIGLKNIKSRIEKINGNLKINSNLGKGTVVIVTIPKEIETLKTKNTILKELNTYKV